MGPWFLGLCLLAAAGEARAALRFGGGLEHFAWVEDTTPLTVEENGVLIALHGGASWPLGGGLVAEYRGRLYIGDVVYEGSLLFEPDVPVTSTTRYSGATHQARLRLGAGGKVEAMAGLDLDLWRRRLGPNQREDFRIVSLRTGIEADFSPDLPWWLGAGIKFTLSTHEDAHLDELGFAQNPSLEPGSSVTPYLDLGYSFSPQWWIVGSFDAFSFGASDEVVLTGNPSGIFHQPASDMRVIGLRLEYRSSPR